MRKAIVKDYLNIRTGTPRIRMDNNPGYYLPGEEISIVEKVIGDKYKGNNIWYKLENGSYVWSGGVNEIGEMEFISSIQNVDLREDRFLWPIKKFNISKMWQFGMGEGVTVAVLDTGVDKNHPELKDVIIGGFNFFDDSNDFSDFDGHGTHCAGIIAAKGLFDVIGVAPKCKLLIGKIKNSESSGINTQILINALEWTIGKADIVSISGGKPDDIPQVRELIQRLIQNNIVVIAAIGNQASDGSLQGDFPARYPETISVGSISEDLNLSPFTIQFANLTVTAPGQEIKSTHLNGSYLMKSGTSMATPFITGVIAVLKSIRRNLTPEDIKGMVLNKSDKKLHGGFQYQVVNPLNLIA